MTDHAATAVTETPASAAAPPEGIVLDVRHLKTHFRTAGGIARAVDGISFQIKAGETFALVGESGCGKSVSALSIMQLVQKPAGFHPEGQLILNGRDILKMSERAKRKLRGNDIAMIFQEPMTSLNPVFTVGQQIMEPLRLHQGMSLPQAKKRAIEMLDLVRMPEPAQRFEQYPHQMSGGQKQRAMIAMALACKPSLLIADEPTTALDVTIQAQILELMKELQREIGMSILLITHDLGVVCEMADRVAVMYAGKIVENADKQTLFETPRHPYTVKLFESLPDVSKRGRELSAIRGMVPPANKFPDFCRFADRCDFEFKPCRAAMPELYSADTGKPNHVVRCYAYDPQVTEDKPKVRRQEAEQREKIAADLEASGAFLQVRGLKLYFPVKERQKTTSFQTATVGNISFIISALAALIFTIACAIAGTGAVPIVVGALAAIGGIAGAAMHASGTGHARQFSVGFNGAMIFAGLIALLTGPGGTALTFLTLMLIGWWVYVLYSFAKPDTLPLKAVDGVDFTLKRGETLALVGESGCGKTTAGKAMLHLYQPTDGTVVYNSQHVTQSFATLKKLRDRQPMAVMLGLIAAGLLGTTLISFLTSPGDLIAKIMWLIVGVGFAVGSGFLWGFRARRDALAITRGFRNNCQIIFQDPYGSLNPRQMVGEILAEGMDAHGIGKDADERERLARELLEQCGLPGDVVNRYPHEFSGGQRQRIGIARALAVNPGFIVCDEPTSALDVSVQAQILNLLEKLKKDRGLTYLFITHDLRTVEYLADEVCVMYLGRIVERGKTQDIFNDPKHPYTRALLEAIPDTDPKAIEKKEIPAGDVPSAVHKPKGCPYHKRCPFVLDVCRLVYPGETKTTDSHAVHCFRYGTGNAHISSSIVYEPDPLPPYPRGEYARVSAAAKEAMEDPKIGDRAPEKESPRKAEFTANDSIDDSNSAD